MEARWGLCPDMGANVVLAGLMKRDQALWLASHAGPVSAEDAKDYGLVPSLQMMLINTPRQCSKPSWRVHQIHWQQLSGLLNRAIARNVKS